MNPINQPLQIQSPSVIQNQKEFFGHEERQSGELPFANYLKQALLGINDAVIEASVGYEEVAMGKGPNLHNVATMDFETHFLLYLAAGVTSNVTKAATTLFQMQF